MAPDLRICGSGADLVLALRARLTDRDRTLLGWLYDHQLLTTPQIAHALVPSLDFAQKRLLRLLDTGLIDRFRPLRYGGRSYPGTTCSPNSEPSRSPLPAATNAPPRSRRHPTPAAYQQPSPGWV
jgi:hypothetical protein